MIHEGVAKKPPNTMRKAGAQEKVCQKNATSEVFAFGMK